jgi:hypothetical protein
MTENPGSQASGTDNVLTDELLQKLDSNEMTINDLSAEQKSALHEHLVKSKDNPEPPKEEPPAETPEKKAEVTEEALKGETKEEEHERVKKWKEEHKKQADEENRWKQKLEAAKKRTETYKTELDGIKRKEHELKDVDIDPIETEHFKNFVKEVKLENLRLKEQVEFLASKFGERDELDAKEYMDHAEKARENGIFASIKDLQDDAPDLKTKTPFEKLNSDWASFLDKLVTEAALKPEDMKMPETADPVEVRQKMRDTALRFYNDDKGFREKADRFKPKSLSDDDEMRKYEIIVDLYNRSQRPATLKAAWLERLDEKGILEDYNTKAKRDAMIEGSNRAADAMSKNKPNTIEPSDGLGVNPGNEGEMSLEIASATVKTLSEVLMNRMLNDKERELQEKAIRVLERAMGH